MNRSSLFRHREVSLFLILIFTIGLTSFINPRFVTGSGTRDLFNSTAVVAIMAVGITPIVIMKHIDLSIASIVGFSAWMIADLCKKHEGFTTWHAFIVGPLIGASVGVLNGILVAGLRLPALVVTLGTLYIVRGLDYVVSNSVDYNAQDLPKSMVSLGE